MITLPSGAKAVSSTVWAVRQLLWDKKIPHIRIGKRFMIDPVDLREFIQRLSGRMNREHRLSKDKSYPSVGLSKQQKQIMEFVRTQGYITSFDTTNSLVCDFECHCDFDKPDGFRRYMASLNVCASRSLKRL